MQCRAWVMYFSSASRISLLEEVTDLVTADNECQSNVITEEQFKLTFE